jgi:predicted  nucleic acid-binding Zn-ribbon protein
VTEEQRAALEESVRTSAVRIENLKTTLAQQEADLGEAKEALTEKERELEHLSGESNEELRSYIDLRKRIVPQIDNALETEYERIRTFHREAVVPLRRNSCSGCFSAVPSQRIMEMKYNRDRLYTCEGCGRILYPEDVSVDLEAMLGQ